MRCPFLRDARVKFCQASAFRKMILEGARDAGHERCSSDRYAECPAASARLAGDRGGAGCPFLQDATVEFCGASPVPRYVPANDALFSRCSSDAHLYCELFLATLGTRGDRRAGSSSVEASGRSGHPTVVIDGVPVPSHLSYAPNHMWLDVAEDGRCHVGIDAFLASVVGAVEAISFAKPGRGPDRPVAVLTVNGVDLTMVFPQALGDPVANAHLRANPGKVTADPYGAGWLFRGAEPALPGAPVGAAARAGLLDGERAARWMFAEADRLADFVHDLAGQPSADGTRLMADGGRVAAGLAAQLGREAVINLFNEFFSPHLTWRRSW